MRFITTVNQGVTLVKLVDEDTDLMTIAPEYGAKLAQLALKESGNTYQLLWPVTMDDLKSNAWYKSAILFPYPNRLDGGAYEFEGKQYQFPINEPDRNNQLHGMIFNEPFEVLNQEVDASGGQIDLIYKYDGSLDYYPFAFDFIVTYKCDGVSFEVTFEVKNKGGEVMPFGLGWHPYFQINGHSIESSMITIPAVNQVELNDRAIPTGAKSRYQQTRIDLKQTRLDDGFEIIGGSRCYSLADQKTGVSVEMSGTSPFEYIQIFTPPGNESVAIEPMTCNVNAFNNKNGLRKLGLGESFSSSFALRLKSET